MVGASLGVGEARSWFIFVFVTWLSLRSPTWTALPVRWEAHHDPGEILEMSEKDSQ